VLWPIPAGATLLRFEARLVTGGAVRASATPRRFVFSLFFQKSSRGSNDIMTIAAEKKREVVAAARRHDNDSGSPEVQVSILTERIFALQDHFRANKKDHSSRRGLLLMVGRRNRLLKYLAATNFDSYQSLIKRLGLRK